MEQHVAPSGPPQHQQLQQPGMVMQTQAAAGAAAGGPFGMLYVHSDPNMAALRTAPTVGSAGSMTSTHGPGSDTNVSAVLSRTGTMQPAMSGALPPVYPRASLASPGYTAPGSSNGSMMHPDWDAAAFAQHPQHQPVPSTTSPIQNFLRNQHQQSMARRTSSSMMRPLDSMDSMQASVMEQQARLMIAQQQQQAAAAALWAAGSGGVEGYIPDAYGNPMYGHHMVGSPDDMDRSYTAHLNGFDGNGGEVRAL
jgi:hypothetical protein